MPDGEYEFFIVLDYDNSVSEADENNNTASIKVVIKDGQIKDTKPDVQVEGEEKKAEKPRYDVLKKESDIKPAKLSLSENQNPVGTWKSVDFVQEIEDFEPGVKSWTGDLYLKHMMFMKGGRTSGTWRWTNGFIIHSNGRTRSRYEIKKTDDSTYLFFPWLSGDVTIRGQKPRYYVLKKVSAASVKNLPMKGEKADIPTTSTMNKSGRIEDKIDYPFVYDPEVIGKWTSVDFVENIEDFRTDSRHWRGRLFLKNMSFFENGRTKGPWSWTKGLIIHPGDKTAAKYFIKQMNGSTYMFFEWKSGDYTIRRMKPSYYVLKKASK